MPHPYEMVTYINVVPMNCANPKFRLMNYLSGRVGRAAGPVERRDP
jgi:hypothetical protein